MGVRSKQLFAGLSGPASSYNVVYTCPADRTTIVKSVHFYWRVAGPVLAELNLFSGGTQAGVARWTLSSGEWVDFEPWWVMRPTDTLRLFSPTTDAVRALISGAELLGVAP